MATPISQQWRDRRNSQIGTAIKNYWVGRKTQGDFGNLTRGLTNIQYSGRYNGLPNDYGNQFLRLAAGLVTEARFYDRNQKILSLPFQNAFLGEVRTVQNIATVEADRLMVDVLLLLTPTASVSHYIPAAAPTPTIS